MPKNYFTGEIKSVTRYTHFPKQIIVPMQTGQFGDVTKDEFVAFIKAAMRDRKGPEYRQLYFFLLYTFKAGDAERKGRVGLAAFDRMIETAVEAPRRFGLAPASEQMFKSDEVRISGIKLSVA